MKQFYLHAFCWSNKMAIQATKCDAHRENELDGAFLLVAIVIRNKI